MDSGGAVESPEAARPAAVALDFTDGEVSSPSRIPRRIRRRLLESKNSGPSSVEEIESKLRDADLRRQQFHDLLSSKARPKLRSPSWSSKEDDSGQRLSAKLFAAEQNRLSLLAKAQMRLARLDELRQAAKSGVKMRFNKEREELGTRVESRVQQAEANRMRLIKAHMQRRAAIQERTARSLMQRVIRENKYKECVRSAIFQKRAAAEKKRLGLLEAEKKRVHARIVQARRVAKTVYHRRETERRRMKEQLENRLQKAKRQRAEYLKQRGSPRSSAQINLIRHGDFLSRELARCWRQFVRSRRTTFALAKAYEALEINQKSVISMPFEQVAVLIESTTTLETAKALLDRLESRFSLLLSSGSSSVENIDHLLKHLSSPNKKVPSSSTPRERGGTKRAVKESRSSETKKLSRYPVRLVLCAYMIFGHPNAVFSGQGDREAALRESAINFIREFELLVKIILDGPMSARSSRQSSPDDISANLDPHEESSTNFPREQGFRCHLGAVDSAWCSYLYRFVVWKVKDARSLEDDLVRAACQLELSMIQTCKVTAEGQTCDLSHDMRAIQKQVNEDQKLLREKVQHLSGNAGIERMECALSDTRSKFFEAKENSSPLAMNVAHISSPSSPSGKPLVSVPHEQSVENEERTNHVVHSLLGISPSTQPKVVTEVQNVDVQSTCSVGTQSPAENELLVNEIMHWSHGTFNSNLDMTVAEGIGSKVKEMMEKAFWDGVLDSLKEDRPNYSRILGLVKEVRDELSELAPQSWKQEILNSIDLDILAQVLESGSQDMDYLGKILEYVLAMLQKLSSPASEDHMRKDHQKLLNSLADIAQSDDKRSNSFVIATIKGLRFVLEQIQALKKEVSLARVQLMEPIIKGTAGLEYLQKAFADRYGSPVGAANSLPVTLQWLSSSRNSLDEEWNEHIDCCSVFSASHGVPVTALRTGGGLSASSKQHDGSLNASGGDELPECSGETVDKLVRLGLLKLASAIEGLTTETVPETLKLNVLRLRTVQSQFQQITVITTSILVLQQVLLSEKSAGSPSELEVVVSNTVKGLSELLKRVPDVGIQEITELMVSSSSSYSNSSSETELQSRKEMMAGMLAKSLQSDDAVFRKVSRSIYLATRGVILGGNGAPGQKLADAALRRIGATMLLDQVVNAGNMLIIMAIVTNRVHWPWYRVLV